MPELGLNLDYDFNAVTAIQLVTDVVGLIYRELFNLAFSFDVDVFTMILETLRIQRVVHSTELFVLEKLCVSVS